ncbi:MAG: zf-TFIIB domain-containing protein [Pseudomonadota bacterium]
MADGVFKCANCGGNPPADSVRCPYCDVHLTSQRCGRCLAHGVSGDRHCRACGHPVGAPSPVPRGPDHVLECPRCDAPMRAGLVGDVLIDECRRCSGLWLHLASFEGLLTRTEHDQVLAAVNALRRPEVNYGRNRPEAEDRFYINCPECDKQMQRRQFAGASQVVVDVCGEHGIWFDQDELSAIVSLIRSGGLDRQTVLERLKSFGPPPVSVTSTLDAEETNDASVSAARTMDIDLAEWSGGEFDSESTSVINRTLLKILALAALMGAFLR